MAYTLVEYPAEFLQQTGLLYEINRNILHPLGLCLSLDVEHHEEDGSVTKFQLFETDADVGFIFSEEDMNTQTSRFQSFMDTRTKRVLARAHKLGYITQKSED